MISLAALLPTPRTSDTNGPGLHGDGGMDLRTSVTLLPTTTAADAKASGGAEGSSNVTLTDAIVRGRGLDWAQYGPAIRRWERVTGRRAPAPTEPNTKGEPRLSAWLTEWMMGVSEGWICDTEGISRNDKIKAAGNGVVPQQAAAALRDMLFSFQAQEDAA